MSDQTPEVFGGIDLDAERSTRAAQREGRGITGPIRIGGQVIAELPVELPVDVLTPLRNLDGDITLILREAMTAAQAQKGNLSQVQWDMTNVIIDLLATNPALPVSFLDTISAVGKGLLGEDGFAALLAARPSVQDYTVLVKGVFAFYGVSLGEASPSSDSSGDSGGTSNTTSKGSESTPDASGEIPALTASSASGGS